MMNNFIAYPVSVIALMAGDSLWFRIVARNMCRRDLGHLLAPDIAWWAVVSVYLVYGIGVVFFAVRPALAAGSMQKAVLHGALLGLMIFAVYDLTNLGLLRDWPLPLSLIDIAWGVFNTSASATAAYFICSWGRF